MLKLFDVIPKWAIWLAALAVAGVAAYAWHTRVASQAINGAVKADRAQWQAQAQAKLDAAEKRAIDRETKAAIAELENQIAQDARNRLAQADAGRARSERDGLRNIIAAMLSGGGTTSEGAQPLSIADAGPALARSLSECSSRYTEVAGVADQAINQVTALQSYITRVVGPVCLAMP
jgi:hypothetical protein